MGTESPGEGREPFGTVEGGVPFPEGFDTSQIVTPTSPPDARVLGGLKRCPTHWHTLTAAGGFAAIRCHDCGFQATGGYDEVVEKWNAHLPVKS